MPGEHQRHGRDGDHEPQIGLRLAVALGERRDDAEIRGAEQDQRRAARQIMRSSRAGPRFAVMPSCSSPTKLMATANMRHREHQRDEHVRRGGEDLAVDQMFARHGRRQQHFERAALAFAGGGVDGEVQAAEQHRQQHEVGHHVEHEHRAAAGRRHVDLLHGDRQHRDRIDAAREEAQLRDLDAVVARPARARGRTPRRSKPRELSE